MLQLLFGDFCKVYGSRISCGEQLVVLDLVLAGNLENLEAQMRSYRSSMQDVLQLTEIPDIEEEDVGQHHMRVVELVAGLILSEVFKATPTYCKAQGSRFSRSLVW